MEQAEVAVIGAGPIGLETAVALKRAGVSYVQLEAGAIRKHEIEKDNVNLLLAEKTHPVGSGRRLLAVETVTSQKRPQHILKDGLVIDYEDGSGSCHRCNLIVARAPPCSASTSPTSPPN